MPRRAPLILIALAVVVMTSAACTGERPTLAETVDTTATTTATTLDEHPQSLVAEATGATIGIYSEEGASSSSSTLAVADQVGKHLVFLVVDDRDDWLEVLLPVTPNDSTGWVRHDDVRLTRHDFRIEVSRASHRMRVYRGDRIVLDEPVGIGTTDTPAAGQSLYITGLIEPPDPAGLYGPFAYGLSGYAIELTDFASGDGVVAIHGTNDPAGVGADDSHGCVRLTNAAIEQLVTDIGLPLGTPVEILA